MPAALGEPVKNLIQKLVELEAKPPAEHDETELIHVSHITRGLGFLYEKIRNTLDYKEESLWTKNTILRILRRNGANAMLAGDAIGKTIIQELIRGRYLENDAIRESKAYEIEQILAKYRTLWEAAFSGIASQSGKERAVTDWIVSLAACEVEETLRRSQEDDLYLRFLYEAMRDRIEFPVGVAENTAKLQMYLASYRSIMQADTDMESWTSFKLLYPDWKNAGRELISEVGRNLESVKRHIEEMLFSPYRRELDRIFKRRSLHAALLRDILGGNLAGAETILTEPEKLETILRTSYDKRYGENRARLRRTAFRAVLFIFFTKMLLAFVIEAPYEIWTTGKVDYYPMAFNVLLPASILLAASLSIRMPGEAQNFVKLLVDFNRILGADAEPLDVVRVRKRRATIARISIGIFYIANFALTFGIILWISGQLGFNPVSTALLVIFLSLVSFFAVRLRKTANELAAIDESEHWARQLFDFIIFPVVEVGRFLNWGFRSLNVVVALFDFLLEAPFRTMVEILEEWFSFLKERKESL